MFKNEISASPYQRLHWIEAVKSLVPEMFVVPGVFADGQRHAVAAEIEQLLVAGGGEIAHFVEDVVGGQQHLRLQKGLLAVLQKHGRIHDGFAGLGMGGSDQAADDANAAGFRGNPVD